MSNGVESCRFCGVEGRATAKVVARAEEPVSLPVIGDDEDIEKLCDRYIADVKASTLNEKVSDERLMRAVEAKLEIPAARVSEFRREVMNYVGALAVDGRKFSAQINFRVHKALVLILEDVRSANHPLT